MLFGTSSGNRWDDILTRIETDSLNVSTATSRMESSDHVPFHDAGIPAVHYHTGMHSDYHTEKDTADKINVNGMLKVADHAEKLIRELAKEDPESFQFGQMNRQPNPVIEPGTPTLGLLPDYLFRGSGLRIEEVTSGEKADRAGLQSGDIITGMNGIIISDIFEYMDALKAIREGESVKLEYRRNDKAETVIIPF